MSEINLNTRIKLHEIIRFFYLAIGVSLSFIGVLILIQYMISFSHVSFIGFFVSTILIKTGNKFTRLYV